MDYLLEIPGMGSWKQILPGRAAGEERVQLFHKDCGIQLGELAAKDKNGSWVTALARVGS